MTRLQEPREPIRVDSACHCHSATDTPEGVVCYNPVIILLVCYSVGATVTVACLGYCRSSHSADVPISIEDLTDWKYTAEGLRLFDLKLDDGSSLNASPTVSVNGLNYSDARLMFGFFVAFFDVDGRLLAAACLAPAESGIVAPGGMVRLSAALPIPRGDIARIRGATVRVTRGKIVPMRIAMR